MMKIETTILKNLLQNEDYARKVLPFLNNDYFTENCDKIVYDKINDFIIKYYLRPGVGFFHIFTSKFFI